MANTLNLGDGKWATKYGSTLAYNDENGNFKPLPFLFERRGNATRVNKEGLIEVVGEKIPRIDYLNDSNGALKLEPSRTNLVTYSENFAGSGWNNFASITPIANSIISPQGILNASTLECSGNNVFRYSFTASSSTNYVGSIFVKAKETTNDFGIQTLESGTAYSSVFNIESGIVVTQASNHIASIEDFGNGWFRCSVKFNSGSSTSNIFDFKGSQTLVNKEFYAWGAQLEQGNYATSYIPTQGSAVTRLADNTKIVNSPILQATNQFTLFFDAKDFVNYGATFANIMITLGAAESPYDAGTGIHIYNKIWFYYNGSSAVNLGNCYNATTDSKFAISYDGTKFTRYSNGVKLGTTTTSASMSNWDTLTNGSLSYSGVDRIFNIADLKLYNTALSDSEAIALTQV